MFVKMHELVGPTMHAAITREPQTLPISTNTPVTPLLVSLLFGEKQSWALDTIANVKFMLGKYAHKEFDQGTYAIILPPLHFKLVTTQGKVKVKSMFYCEVRNAAGRRQWPTCYNND